jgi:hypothetical protein
MLKKKAGIYSSLLILILLAGIRTFAQHDLSIYNMQLIPQRIYQNPAFITDQKWVLGLPLMSSFESAYANPFSYNDLIERDPNDSVTLKIENFLSKLNTSDKFRLYSNIDILSFGTQIDSGRFWLGFSIRERISQHVMIPVSLGNFIWYGNASPEVFGKNVNIAPSYNVTAYDEWGISFSGYALKRKMTWGARLKYLSGRINSTTKKAVFEINTDTNTYAISMKSDFEIHTSGIDDIEHYLDQRVMSLVFPGNNGMGIDLGATYRINDHFTVNASVLDIGFIRWKVNTVSYTSHVAGEEFAFEGLTLKNFVDMLSNLDDFGKELTDSILDLVDVDTTYVKYTSWLPVKYNIGGTYGLNDHHHFNLLLNGISWNKHFYPALSVSYYYQLKKFLGLMLSYNIYNHQYLNFGAGLSIRAGAVQLYAVSDNVPGLIWYHDSSNSSIQVGINFMVGRKTETAPEASNETK